MRDEHALMLCVGILAVAGVALVLYQHAMATAQITAALGANGLTASASTNAQAMPFALGASVSLAGTPTIGQAGSSAAPAVIPTQINPGGYLQ